MQQTATAALLAGTARTWEAAYPGRADQLRHVRAALRPQLRGCPVADEVLLLASELAANAIAHSDSGQPGGTFTIRLHHHGDHIRAEIQDQGSTWDGDLARSARHRHGLYLLLTLSTQCGIDPGPHSQTPPNRRPPHRHRHRSPYTPNHPVGRLASCRYSTRNCRQIGPGASFLADRRYQLSCNAAPIASALRTSAAWPGPLRCST